MDRAIRLLVNPLHNLKWAGSVVALLAAGLLLASSASAALVVATTNQLGAVPLTPAWTAAGGSLIAGLAPTTASGNFGEYTPGNVNNLTTPGTALTINRDVTAPNMEVAGNDGIAGSLLVYTLPASAYGYDLTNITVYGGWQDAGRDAQAYTVSYSTVANPGLFLPLTSVNFNPSNPSSTGCANRVSISDSSGGAMARNVAALQFNFTTPPAENGACGYTAIWVGGVVSTNLLASPMVVTISNQHSSSSFTPSWPVETESLIAGLIPSVGAGNFAYEPGVTGLSALTDGIFGPVDNRASYATCGLLAGQSVTYALNAARITNIVVYSGWLNQNRDGQFYDISYSTVSAPSTFLPLTSVFYNPAVTGISACRVAISTTNGLPLATNVAFLKFDFTPQDSGTDYGYSGYAEIIVKGTNGPALAMVSGGFPASSSDSADAVLVFNELMYHPATNEAGMEWVECYNQLAVDIDISGWRVSGDIEYAFPAGTRLAGRSHLVLARDPMHLKAVTGLSSSVFGPFTGALNNSGGTLNLYNHVGRLMDTVTFGTEDDWPVTPDGAGPSLAKLAPDWGSSSAGNWAASAQIGGTPGGPNFPWSALPVTVAFNEHSGTTNTMFWVELMNYGTNPVVLENCVLHHDGATDTDYRFPAGVTLQPGAFLVLPNSTLGFLSPATGDKLFLFGPDEAAVYDGIVLKKRGRARFPDGTGTWLSPNLPTPGASNTFAFRTELVINEIMYDHKDFPAASSNSLPQGNPEEWLELYNRGSNTVDLTSWTLAGGISYAFTPGKTIAPGGYLVVASDAATLRATYPAADIVGNYSGHLGNNDDQIILNDPLGNPANQVHYYSGGRWPESAGGGGSSLELRDPKADNSVAETWAASKESPKSAWQTYTYRMVAQASATPAPDSQWRDFVLGLLADGECWVDDISVIQSPTNNPVQLVSNGNFEQGATGWRFVGNHQRSAVETDPDAPGNHVLHLVASGPQEHMNNHIEMTLANGASVVNGQLYEISFRARWLTGCHLLNTRLYFNRVARTTALACPQLNGTPGAANSVYATNLGPTFASFQHQPVVPLPGQPVTVFVRAQDPQGVTNCAVWWSVNGGAWTSAPMLATNGGYAGTIPKLSASSLVQFYVRAVDGRGAGSTYPAKGTNSGAFYRVYDGLGEVTQAHNLRILMSPANVALLYAVTNLMSNENLPCTVIYDEQQAYYDMAVRLKSSERGRVDATRIGFHLQFNPDELFRGVHPVMLVDRSCGGPRPQQEEMLVKHMVVHAGLNQVNADLCKVLAPQTAQNGWAILSPRYEDNFVRTLFTNGSAGILNEFELTYYPLTADANGYKLPSPDRVQGVDISDLGNDKETYRYNFIIKNHRNTDDYSTFINFAKSWSLTGAALATQTRRTTDLDEWLSVYAMVSLCGVSDTYTFGNNHNLTTYVRPEDGRVLYFPWDMDFSFNQSATASLVGDQNLSRIVNLPGNLRRFYAHILDHINTTYNATYMAPWVSHYQSFPGQDWSGDLNYITQRGNYALAVINSAGGNTPFSVSGPNPLTVSNNLVTLSGTAPVSMTSLLVNGASYPVTWTSLSTWTVQVPVSSPTNSLNVQGYDLHGNLLTNRQQTVVFRGTVPDPRSAIVLNEIMYAPAPGNPQFIELYNHSTNAAFDLSGWHLPTLAYTFPSGSILPSTNYLVLAADEAAFVSAYGSTLPVFDTFSGVLPAAGTLALTDAQGVTVTQVQYANQLPWPTNANGTGASLQLVDPHQDNWRAGNWAAVLPSAPTSPQWVYVTATGTASSSTFYLYLQSAGDVYVDDIKLVAGSVPEAGANVVPDGNFESGFPGPWTVSANLAGSALSTAVKHSGNASLHLLSTSPGSTQSSALWQTISPALTANATYTLSFWYLQSTNGGPLTLRLSGFGILATVNPAPSSTQPALATPGALNSVAGSLTPFPSLWLNEVQADNVTGLTNRAGQHTGWLELYNPSTNVIPLKGLYLANNYTNLLQWALPTNASIEAGQFKVVFADGQTNLSTSTEWHTGFVLPSGSGSVALTRLTTNGQPQVLDYLDYQGLAVNDSYGSLPDGQSFVRQEFFQATPGATNDSTALPPASFILYSQPGAVYAQNFDALPNPGAVSVNTANPVVLNGVTYSLANPYGFAFPILASGDGGLGLSALAGWYGNSAALSRFGATDGDQTTGGQISFGLPNSPNRALGLLATSSTGGTAFGARFINGTGMTLNRLYLQYTGAVWRQSNLPKTLQFFYAIDPTGTAPFPAVATAFIPALNVSFPTVAADSGGIAVDGTAPLNQTNLSVLNQAITSWAPGAALWLVWQMTDSTGKAQGLAVDNLRFSASVPQPVPVSAQISGGNLVFHWPTMAGQIYQLQYKNNLTDPVWTPLGAPVTGTGSPATLSDAVNEQPQRFYRLLASP